MSVPDNNKIILKTNSLPGIDMSVIDLSLVSSVKVGITKVTNKIYKIRSQTFIGTRDQLDVQDIIQVGFFGIKYRVRKLEKMTDRNGYIYKIRRLDGAATTSLDMDAVKLGAKVRIVNRKTFEQLFNYACSLTQENPVPTTVCEDELLPCETCETTEPRTTVIGGTGDGGAALKCLNYAVNVPTNTEGIIHYNDCNGEPQIIEYPSQKSGNTYPFCALEGTVVTEGSVQEVGDC